MCVIAVKKKGVAFPKKEYLENCFESNPDGAGFMFLKDGNVVIRKGYDTFDKFWNSLGRARLDVGDNAEFVMHFRIATQGFDLSMTHPFPLSENMADLKRLKSKCAVGIAHNGIIELTSDGAKGYSDTMKFITDYLTLLVGEGNWRKKAISAIENMTQGSRFAFLDRLGNLVLAGTGWVEQDGVLYSNSSFLGSAKKTFNLFDYSKFWNRFERADGTFDFDEGFCPLSVEGDDSMCEHCNSRFCIFKEDFYGKAY